MGKDEDDPEGVSGMNFPELLIGRGLRPFERSGMVLERTGLPWMMTSEASDSDVVGKSPGLFDGASPRLCLDINGLRSVNVLDVFLGAISES